MSDLLTESKAKFVFKIVIIGDPAVGKTSLIKKYTQGNFKEDYIQTIGAQLSTYKEEINGDNCTLFFWDIAGQDPFYFLRPAFYEGSRACIIVFSLEQSKHGKESFEHIDEWHDDIKEHCGDLPIILFGNKVDLVDEKTLNDKKVWKFVKKRGFIGYYRTSAKTGQAVVQSFRILIKELHNKYKKL